MRDSKVKRVTRTLPSRRGLRMKAQAEVGIADRELDDAELNAVVAAKGDDGFPSNGSSTFGKK